MEDEAKKREEARMRLIQQAEQRKQKEIEERKKYIMIISLHQPQSCSFT